MADRTVQDTLRHYVVDVLGVETDLATALKSQRDAMRAFPEVADAIERCYAMVERHGAALRSYLEGAGGAVEVPPSMGRVLDDGAPRSPRAVSDVLRADHMAFTYAATGYAQLFEVALRLYDPALRVLAPAHLQAHAEAAHTIGELLISTVAAELAASGLECRCVCPMCSMGICGCVSVGGAALGAVWHDDKAAGAGAAPGFPLPPPRSGSALALAGIRGGARLLEVDGRRVTSIGEIQAAIRSHPIGGDVRLLIETGSSATREIHATHVGDYPPG
ncbi:MAG TPA: PDZ domain-containing protein [Acidimicrobiales bacterium]|nr:PDZ domain-containing protein [Acidimicrobiales bacterium]